MGCSRVEPAGADHDVAGERGEQRALVVVEHAIACRGTEEVEEGAALRFAELLLALERGQRVEVGLDSRPLVLGSRGEELRGQLGETRIRTAAASGEQEKRGNKGEAGTHGC